MNTSRYSSEWATDFIKRGRPFVFEISVDGGDANTVIATKLAAAFAEYEKKFFTTDNSDGSLPFNYTVGTTVGTDDHIITMTLKAGELAFQETTTFVRKNDTFGLDVPLTAAPELAGTEANIDGKYLEENVRMSIGDSVDGAYAISAGERPIISAPYVTVSWEMQASIDGDNYGWQGHKRLQTFASDVETGSQVMKYTMYFNGDVFGTLASTTGGSQLADLKAFLLDAV